MTIEIRNRWTGETIRTIELSSLRGADLSGANLSDADLSGAKSDFLAVLDASPDGVAGLLAAICGGKIDGAKYEGPCACLKGTIANIRGCYYQLLGDGVMMPDASAPSEKLFLALSPGHTPDNHPIAKIIEGWIVEWQMSHQ